MFLNLKSLSKFKLLSKCKKQSCNRLLLSKRMNIWIEATHWPVMIHRFVLSGKIF